MPPKAPAETVLSIEIIIMQSELVNKYSEIERKFFPVMDYLEKYKQEEPYKSLYKGFITLQSPLFLNPEILFLVLIQVRVLSLRIRIMEFMRLFVYLNQISN